MKKITLCNWKYLDLLFFRGLTVLSNFTNANSLSSISMNNQECKTRAQVINVIVFFPFSIETSKCTGSCNTITIHMQNFVFLTW